jgi:sugar phosphate isomerase/epimerase
MAEHAAKVGVNIALENMPCPKGWGRRLPGVDNKGVFDLIEGLGDHVGMCFDTGHSFLNGDCLEEEVRIAGEKLLSVHLQDNDGEHERHWSPGRGIIDWQTFIAELRSMEYAGCMTFEVIGNEPDHPPQKLVPKMGTLMKSWEQKK